MLTLQERKALKDMIHKTSSAVLEKYNNQSIKDADIVFLGDSMVEYLNVSNLPTHLKVSNRGVAGATTQLIEDNLNIIFKDANPSKIFLSVGSNNLVLLEDTAVEAAEKIVALLEKINFMFPFSTIYYLSTTPVVEETSKVYKKIYVAGRKNEDNLKINEIVKSFCKNDNFIFINQYDSLLNINGYLEESLTPDGIHLNKKGYEIYSSNLIPFLKETCE